MENKASVGNKIIEMKASKFGETKLGSATLLAPRESLTFKNCEELEDKFNELMNRQETRIILNLKEVPLLDSEALQLLIRIHEALSSRRGALKIIGMNDVCRDIFCATRLINVFHVFEDIHEAIKCGT